MSGEVYLLDASQTVIGRLDPSYSSLTITRRWRGVDTVSLEISRSVLYADQIVGGCFLYSPDGAELYLVEQIDSDAETSARNDNMVVSGRSVDGFAEQERRVIPADLDHDDFSGPVESAIKHYVDHHAGPSATANRRVPNFVIAADGARGATVDVSARYQSILDVLAEIGLATDMGWGATYDPTTGHTTFDVIIGNDLTASVFFDFDFETLEKWVESWSALNSKSYVIVAGQGEAAARDIVNRYMGGAEPTGFNRREAFVDARDVPLGSTGILAQKGDAFLAGLGIVRSVEGVASPVGSFKYRTDYDLGDIVTVRSLARGLSYAARVVQVMSKTTNSLVAPTITLAFDRPLPSVQDQVQSQIQSSSGIGTPIVDLVSGGGGGGSPNLDGGLPDSVYGGTVAIDGGVP